MKLYQTEDAFKRAHAFWFNFFLVFVFYALLFPRVSFRSMGIFQRACLLPNFSLVPENQFNFIALSYSAPDIPIHVINTTRQTTIHKTTMSFNPVSWRAAGREIRVVDEGNRSRKIQIAKDTTINEVLSQVVPGQEDEYIIERFGVVRHNETKLYDIIKDGATSSTFLLFKKSRPFPIPRDTKSSTTDDKIKRRVDTIMAAHWSTFNHSTGQMTAFLAAIGLPATKQQEKPSSTQSSQPTRQTFSYSQAVGKPSSSKDHTTSDTGNFAKRILPALSEIEETAQLLMSEPSKYGHLVNVLSEWDCTAGDCTMGHVRLKRLLELDELTKTVQWDLVACHKMHSFLVGVTITGSMIITDVGSMKESFVAPRRGSMTFSARMGTRPNSSPPKIQVIADENTSAVLYKVTTTPGMY